MKFIQNHMHNAIVICYQGTGLTVGSNQVTISPGETVHVEDEVWDRIKKESAAMKYFDTKRVTLIEEKKDDIEPTIEASGDPRPENFPDVVDSGNAQTDDGKIVHEVKSVEQVAVKQSGAPSGGRRGSK